MSVPTASVESVPAALSKQSAQEFESQVSEYFSRLRSQGIPANDAAAVALKIATNTAKPPVLPAALSDSIQTAAEQSDLSTEQQLKDVLFQLFSSPDTLATSFALPAGQLSHQQGQVPLNVDFSAAQRIYGQIRDHLSTWQSVVLEASMATVERLHTGAGLNKQRAVCILLENPCLEDPMAHSLVAQMAERVAAKWPDQEQDLLVECLKQYTAEQLQQAVGRVQSYVTIHFYNINGIDDSIAHATHLLSLMHRANEATGLIPYTDFHNGVVAEGRRPMYLDAEELVRGTVNQEDFDLRRDYLQWRRSLGFSFCGRYSFVYGPVAKAELLHLENHAEQVLEFQEAVMQAFMAGGGPIPFLYLKVRRGAHLVNDTMLQLQNAASRGTLKQPLKVKFAGEEGIDEGGPSKELFQLLMRQLFDPSYGMFLANETTRLYWFRPSSMDLHMEFELVGTLLALAIYNGHVLELSFPMVTYKKLLGRTPVFDDLKEVHPEVYDSLQKLRRMGQDELNSLQLTFQVEQEGDFGAANHVVDLKADGGTCPVMLDNREQYIACYTDHLLSSSIHHQFQSFRVGFSKLCQGPSIQRFQPEELEQLVCGRRDLNFAELESACHYEDGYASTSEAVRWFWEVAHALPEAGKRRLLSFITGSDRVPIDGLRNLRPPFTISRNGAHSSRLPTAHTCFNHLLLPQYKDKEALHGRIELAINNAEGFGLR